MSLSRAQRSVNNRKRLMDDIKQVAFASGRAWEL